MEKTYVPKLVIIFLAISWSLILLPVIGSKWSLTIFIITLTFVALIWCVSLVVNSITLRKGNKS